jgi:hypothetical protein
MALSQTASSSSSSSTSHSRLPTSATATSVVAIPAAADFTSLPQPPPPLRLSTNDAIQSQNRPSSTLLTDLSGLPSSDYFTRSKHRQSLLSTSSKQSRSGLFTLAALARDKTSSAIANLSEPSIRTRSSTNSLYRTAQSSPTSITSPTIYSNTRGAQSPDSLGSTLDLPQPQATPSTSPHSRTQSTFNSRQSLLETNPPSQAYSDTASNTPPPISFVPGRNNSKMHQTSSRLLRMTDDERPFTRVSLTLTWNTLYMAWKY